MCLFCSHAELQRDELRAAANHDQFPRVYGGCWSELWSARTVLEYVEGWLTLCDDSAIDCMFRNNGVSNARF
jgi:hypothetical protein